MSIDRRSLLGSIAATAVCAPMAVDIKPVQAATQLSSHLDRARSNGAWWFAKDWRPQAAGTKPIVDFWSRPYNEIPYGRCLPSGIHCGKMWYQECDADAVAPNASHIENPQRLLWSPESGVDMATVLRSLTGQNDLRHTRTAFLALDSLSPYPNEPAWAEMLPAFRRYYDRVVGHFHLERRGLHQWKEYLVDSFPPENGKSYYQSYFCDAALLCDAVVLTSSALVETDFGLSACEGAEAVAGELIRRFACALLDDAVVSHVAGNPSAQSSPKPRVYVLTSVSYEYQDHPDSHLDGDLHIENMLFRQKQLIEGSFDETAGRTLPILIVTGAANLRPGQIEARLQADQTLFRLRPSTRGTMSCDACGRPAKSWLQMIALWPIHVVL